MESSSASSRAEAFPAGLRVLVVDDDPTWLKILEKMLRKCSYEVTTCGLARDALDMLRERRDRFDIVISDVNMPDMDGFKLLEHVGLEMDLPVIMMSVDGETSRVMKGVQHGACDYLLKPVRMKELKNIWQHVVRKKILEIKEIESRDGIEDFQFIRNRFEELDERHIFYGGDFNSNKKRKDPNNKEYADHDFIDASSVKKARVVWSVDLHQKFVNAVNQIGFDKVGPKKILDLMNVPGLTRENVASHLQKYRLYLSRLQKQNEGIGFGGVMQSEFSPKDSAVRFSLQSLSASPQNSSNVTHSYSGKGIHAKGLIPELDGDDFKGVAAQVEDSKKVSTNSTAESHKTKTFSQLDAGKSPKVEFKQHDPVNPVCYSWEGAIPKTQFMEYPRQHQDPFQLFSDNKNMQQGGIGVGDDYFSTEPPAFSATQAKTGSFQTKPPTTDYGRYQICNVPSPMASTVDSVSVRVEPGETNSKPLGATLGICGTPSARSRHPDQFLIDSVGCTNLTEESTIPFSQKDHILCSLQGYSCLENVGLNSMEFLQFSNPTGLAEFPGNFCEGLQFDYVFDLMEYPTVDGGLFT